MKVLTTEEMLAFLPQLESDFPRSLPMYHLMRNVLRQRFAWPGTEFLVDTYPHPSVCICRPRKSDPAYVPIMNGYQVFVYSKDAEVFRRMLFDEPDTLDWTQNVVFADLPEEEQAVILGVGQGFRGGTFQHLPSTEGFPAGQCYYRLDWSTLNLKFEIPDGFLLGTLQPEHADQVARERNYGHMTNNAIYFRYMLEKEFPTAAVFPAGSDTPIAYCLYKSEGVIAAAYTHPDYRRRGFFQLVLRALLQKLKDMGEVNVWLDTRKFNPASQAAFRAVGAEEYEEYTVDWMQYWPAGCSPVPNKNVV
ncbi:uncharacterized protein LOC129596659 [Paramacrobiotus metropolitanus]|uniref:uncharacterized protein LOC129596659 n=1 Tax=Paramacrobiotus metropolitanus TaxID=2943436 RepID=UPI002446362A|nr:uncharacterized protein LOC129596659 [Paramacrobiotus metropolitanus]